jgi:organic hydroperoxide reductase OsmC/OhrA
MQHLYTASIQWKRGEQPFTDNRYSRAHRIRFDGGAELKGSSSPLSVREPMSDPSGVDPEEMLVASISSCHMLWFLGLAATAGLRVDSYSDEPEGVMEKDAEGKVAVTRVTLRPRVVFSGDKLPTRAELDHLHHEAHERCFIANSVKSEIVVEVRE